MEKISSTVTLYSNGDMWKGRFDNQTEHKSSLVPNIGSSELNGDGMAYAAMEAKITETYLYYLTAKEIWDVMTRAYSDLENYSQVFELINKARNMRQGEGN